MRVRTGWILAALTIATSACTAILGDFNLEQTDAGATPTADAAADAAGDATGPVDGGCPTGQTSCASGCADLQKAAANCGACGHDCNGGTCAAGACGSYVIAKQPTTGTVAKLASDGKRVLWADTGIVAINQIAATGGGAITLAAASTLNGPVGPELGLAKNGTVAFAYVGGTAAPSVGLAVVDVADSGAAVFHGTIAISAVSINPSGTHVVYVNSHGTASDLNDCDVTATRDAGTCGPGVAGGRFSTETAADDSFVFLDLTQANISPSQAGLYLATIGTDATNIFSTSVAASLAVDGTWAYWTLSNPDGGPTFSVNRTLESSPGTQLQTPVDSMASSAFATDGNNVYYWTGSAVASRPVAGGSETNLAPASAFTEIAVGGKLLVWTDGAVISGVVLP